MSSGSRIALTFAFVTVFASTAFAQPPPSAPPRVGDRVRATLLADSSTVTGRLLLYDASGVGIRLDQYDVAEDDVVARKLSRESIARLQVGKTHSHPWRGALIGLFLFPLVWAGGIALGHPEGEEGLAYLGPLYLGPPLGLLLGAGIGGAIQHTEWRTVPLPAPLPAPADTTGALRDSS